jgi:hypothetical protein
MRRSWWLPSSVHIIYVENNICWYPSSYYDRWHDYNRGHRRRRHGNTTIINNNTIIINPTPTPNPVTEPPNIRGIDGMRRIPTGAIISTPSDQFGRIKGEIKTVEPDVAKRILQEDKSIIRGLPKLEREISSDVKVERGVLAKRVVRNEPLEQVQTGATVRKVDRKSDDTLQEQVVRGGRQPLTRQKDLSSGGSIGVEVRETGAVQRPVMRKTENNSDENNRPQPMPKNDYPNNTGNDRKTDENNNRKPVNPPRNNDENRRSTPIYNPPTENNDRKPRSEPRNDTPRYDPPKQEPRNDDRRSEPSPRNDPPKRSEPPPRNDPPREDKRPSSPPSSNNKRSDTEVKDNKRN